MLTEDKKIIEWVVEEWILKYQPTHEFLSVKNHVRKVGSAYFYNWKLDCHGIEFLWNAFENPIQGTQGKKLKQSQKANAKLRD